MYRRDYNILYKAPTKLPSRTYSQILQNFYIYLLNSAKYNKRSVLEIYIGFTLILYRVSKNYTMET